MSEVGDYEAWQYSMWDFAPKDSITLYRKHNNFLSGAEVTCSFTLQEVIIRDGTYTKVKNVTKEELDMAKLQPLLDKGYIYNDS